MSFRYLGKGNLPVESGYSPPSDDPNGPTPSLPAPAQLPSQHDDRTLSQGAGIIDAQTVQTARLDRPHPQAAHGLRLSPPARDYLDLETGQGMLDGRAVSLLPAEGTAARALVAAAIVRELHAEAMEVRKKHALQLEDAKVAMP